MKISIRQIKRLLSGDSHSYFRKIFRAMNTVRAAPPCWFLENIHYCNAICSFPMHLVQLSAFSFDDFKCPSQFLIIFSLICSKGYQLNGLVTSPFFRGHKEEKKSSLYAYLFLSIELATFKTCKY